MAVYSGINPLVLEIEIAFEVRLEVTCHISKSTTFLDRLGALCDIINGFMNPVVAQLCR